jgi:hypothetical protein
MKLTPHLDLMPKFRKLHSAYALMAWCLIKHRDNFTSYFYCAKFYFQKESRNPSFDDIYP